MRYGAGRRVSWGLFSNFFCGLNLCNAGFPQNNSSACSTSGFSRRELHKIYTLLGYYAVHCANSFFDFLTLENGTDLLPRNVGKVYHHTLHNIPEERRFKFRYIWEFKYLFSAIKSTNPINCNLEIIVNLGRVYSLLGVLEKLLKATVNFVISVPLSAWNNSASTIRVFMKLDVWVIFLKIVEKIRSSLNFHKNNGYFIWRPGRLCGLVVRVSGYIYRGLGFDSRRYQIFWVVVGLERGPLSLNWGATWIKSSGSGPENRD